MTEAAAPLPNIMHRTAVRGGTEPADLLPEGTREKLERLLDRKAAAHAALMRVEDERREVRTDLQKAEALLAKFDAAEARGLHRKTERVEPPAAPASELAPDRTFRYQTKTIHPPSDQELAVERAEVAKLQRRLDRLDAEHARVETEWLALAKPATAVARYVETQFTSPVKFADAIEKRVPKGQRVADAVEAARAEIRDLLAKVQRVERAPRPSAETKAAARQMVDALAEHGKPDLRPSVQHALPPRWPTSLTENYAGRPLMDLEAARQHDTPALLAWLLKDRLLAALHEEIDALSDDAQAVPTTERPKRIADLKAQALEVERREEALIELAEQEGVTIHRRPDLDPRAFLNLTADAPEAREC